jgi:undecaprenyl diphosphate synthase
MQLNLALSYSSRSEFVSAFKKFYADIQENKKSLPDIDESMIDSYMQTAGIPDPELMIRTSGELRISNFMLWQLAYSELYFTDKLWPDFGEEDLVDAIYDYQNRERRFGKISEQLS